MYINDGLFAQLVMIVLFERKGLDLLLIGHFKAFKRMRISTRNFNK